MDRTGDEVSTVKLEDLLFKKADFEHLRQEDLEDILSALTDIILDEKGADPATEFKDRMQVLIDECAD